MTNNWDQSPLFNPDLPLRRDSTGRVMAPGLFPMGIGVVKAGVWEFVNDHLCEMLGYGEGELTGQAANLVYPPIAELDQTEGGVFGELCRQGTTAIKTLFKRKNGDMVEVLLHPALFNPHNPAAGVKFTVADITPVKTVDIPDISRQKQIEKSLDIVLTKYKTLFESFPLGITISDQAGNILETNAMAEVLLGLPAAEHTQRQIDGAEWQIVRPDGTPMPPAEYASVRALAENRLVENVEMGVLKPDGQTTWLNVTAAPLPLEGYGTVITYNNITARKRAELALEQTRESLKLAIDGADLGTYNVDLPSGHLEVNDHYLDQLGYARHEIELSYATWLNLIHPDDRPHVFQIQEKIDQREQNDFNSEYRMRHKSGQWVWMLDRGQAVDWDKQGQPRRAAGIHLDITVRKQAEEALREREEQYRTLFENAPLCLFELDLSGGPTVIRRANRQAEALYGWTVDPEVPQPTETVIPLALPLPAQVFDQLRDGKLTSFETQHRRSSGSSFPVRITATPSLDYDLSRVIVAVEDITLEKERLSTDKAIADERQRISREIHDGVAQNLASLRLKVELMHSWAEQDLPRLHTELDFLQEQLRQNIRDVRRAIFALRPLPIAELGFYPALQQFVKEFGEQNQLHIDLRIVEQEKRLSSNLEVTIFRIIQEALNNVTKHAQADAVWVTLSVPSVTPLTLMIRDNGLGFDPASLGQKLQTLHVGLAQMQERVKSLNGTMILQSRPGQGTIIEVSLPQTG
ncbi:MAG TPA: PAS domain S-box protein [Anaerolineae bacterium]|nr:PAS domain S-box protein [Anaerolineae bacterium]HMR62494.1 PAS domain S-box protein [Anaerolineae bacterium]